MPTLTFVNTVLGLSALLALAIGLRGLLAPESLGTGLGYGMSNPNALNEVRAQYGGFFLAVGLVSALGLFGILSRQVALIVLALTFGGILFGRAISLLFDGEFSSFSPTIRALYVVDALGFGAALLALATDSQTS